MSFKFLLFATLCFGQQTHAEEPFKGCIDPLGRSVATIYDNQLPNMGYAALTPSNKPVIIINKKAMAPLSAGTKKFVYWHECAHHSLGHLVNQKKVAIIEEQEADCYGIRVPLTLGLIKHSQLEKLQEDISRLGSGDWEHLPGATRSMNIEKCLGEGYSEQNWHSCKAKFYSNINFINKTILVMKQLFSGCKAKGFKNPDCIQAQALAQQMNDGLQKTVGMIDQECPYVMAPSFSKTLASYSQALNQLLDGK